MGAFVRGEVVVVAYPHSDSLEEYRRRPALVLASLDSYDEFIICMITAKPWDPSVEITDDDFANGHLMERSSFVRPDKLFTAHRNRVLKPIGKLKQPKMDQILAAVRKIFT